jgi:hypothetical protein
VLSTEGLHGFPSTPHERARHASVWLSLSRLKPFRVDLSRKVRFESSQG